MITGVVVFIIISVIILTLVKLSPQQKKYEEKKLLNQFKRDYGIDADEIKVNILDDYDGPPILVKKTIIEEDED
jgi:hypothetical protein